MRSRCRGLARRRIDITPVRPAGELDSGLLTLCPVTSYTARVRGSLCGYVVGMAASLCGSAAIAVASKDVAADVSRRARPAAPTGWCPVSRSPVSHAHMRSPDQEAQAAGSSSFDGVCACDMSAALGAEAHAVAPWRGRPRRRVWRDDRFDLISCPPR